MAEPFYYLGAETVVPRDVVHVIISGSITVVAPRTFAGYKHLARVEFQEGVVEIGWGAFARCPNLVRVDFSSSLRTIHDWAFAWCVRLLELIFREGLRRIGTKAFYGCGLRRITVPSSVMEIGEEAFRSCRNLEAATLAGGMVILAREAFFHCPRLERILISSMAIVVQAGEGGNGRVAVVTGGIEDGGEINDEPKPTRLILTSRYLALMNQEDRTKMTDTIDQIIADPTRGEGPLDLEDEGVAHQIRACFSNCLDEHKADIAAVLELALWKAKMNQTAGGGETAGADARTRYTCRINCGAETVVGLIVSYLWGPHRRANQEENGGPIQL